MVDMPRKLPLFVQRDRSRHGRVRFYFRRDKGRRIRLPDDLQSQEFKDAYDACLRGEAPKPRTPARVPADSLQWLVDRYMESAAWQKELSPASQKQRRLIFADAITRSANPRFADITQATIELAVQKRAATPAQANNFLKAMRGLFAWAKTNGHVAVNPALGVARLRYKSAGFTAWTVDDAKAFCERWPVGTAPRLAFELFIVSGLRRGDVHQVGHQHIRGGTLAIRASKPPHHLITIALPASLLDTIAATDTGDMALMVKDNGEPFKSKESFGNWFSARCRDARLPKGKSAHGLRKLSATLAAEAGSSAHDLMAHYGWSTVQQAEVYTKGADRVRLGKRSSQRLAEEIANKMPRTLDPGAGMREDSSIKRKA